MVTQSVIKLQNAINFYCFWNVKIRLGPKKEDHVHGVDIKKMLMKALVLLVYTYPKV